MLISVNSYNREINKIHFRNYSINSKEISYKPFDTRRDFIQEKSLGNTRYFPAAIKEWKNSSYTFNKNTQRNVASKDEMVNKLIKSYFYFSNVTTKPRSKRMRSLRRKFTSKKLFVSKPEIKQTNDKVIVTIFTFNREKQFLLKKLFFYNRRQAILDLWRKNNKLTPFVEQYKQLSFLLTNGNYNRTITKTAASNYTKNFINQNSVLYDQFNSDLISKKDKLKLYNKVYNKISRNMHKSSIFDNYTKGKKNSFYFLTNKSKVNRYKRLRLKVFKKRVQTTNRLWYVRKKMQKFKSSSSKLTKRQKRIIAKPVIPYSGIKHKNEMNFLSFKLLLKNKKIGYARKLFYFYFLKYILSMFNIKVYAFRDNKYPSESIMNSVVRTDELSTIEKEMKKDGKRNKRSRFVYNINRNTLPLYKSPLSLTATGTKVKLCFYKLERDVKIINKIRTEKTNKNTNKIINLSKPVIINIDTLQNSNKIDNLDYVLSNVNFIISQFLDKILTKSNIIDKERRLYIIFKKYCEKYYKSFMARIENKQKLFSKYYTRLMINRFKFSKLLPNLKLLISKVYNKKTELNIVNLKYSHLNTDIYSEIVALKLRKRLNVLKVIRKALKLAKKPIGYRDISKINIDYDLNKTSYLNIYKSLKLINLNKNTKINNLSLQDVLDKVYPRSMTNDVNYVTKRLNSVKAVSGKMKNILNTIKYKTLSGIRIEAAGRLTRRYTASRAVFKFRHKGSLRDIDYSRYLEHKQAGGSSVMLRNQVKSNSQYTYNHSKRRVGTFGVKGWISGY